MYIQFYGAVLASSSLLSMKTGIIAGELGNEHSARAHLRAWRLSHMHSW